MARRPSRREQPPESGLFERTPLWWELRGSPVVFDTRGKRPRSLAERARTIAAAGELSDDERGALAAHGVDGIAATDARHLLARNDGRRPPEPRPDARLRLVPWAWSDTYPPRATEETYA